MISWIQKYFQRHFRTVFAVLLAITIISFILGINASGGFGRATPGGEHVSRPFYGLDLASADDNQQLIEAATISAHLQLGLPFNIALPPDRLQGFALQRHAALWLADQLHLPASTPAELDAFIKSLRLFASAEVPHAFDPVLYSTFRDSVKADPRITEAVVSRIIADDARIHQVQSLLAGPGYILPGDVSAALELNESSWTVALATVDYASFSPALNPSDADLQKYFSDHPVELPAQVRVDAINFPTESYMDKVSVTEAEARKFYDGNRAAFPKPEVASTPPLLAKPTDPATAPDDFPTVRPAVEAALKLDKARRMAGSAAADFAVSLFEQKITPATLDPLLASQHLARQPLAPFARNAKPVELGVDPENTAKAFRLDATHPFSDEILTPHGAVVLVWQETIAARQPPFGEVRDRVAAEWRAAEKKRLFSELGQTLHPRIEASLKAGTPFEQAVKAAADPVKVEVKTYTSFTLAQKREAGSFDDLSHVLGALATLQKGQVSDMIGVASSDDPSTPSQGQLVYAVDKKVPDLTPTGTQYMSARQQLAAQLAAYAANNALGELVQHELAKSTPAQP